MERACQHRALYSHAQSFTADTRPDRVEFPDLFVGHEPFFLMLNLVPLLYQLILSVLDKSEDINLVLIHVAGGSHQLSQLVLRDDLGIGLKVGISTDSIFQVQLGLVLRLHYSTND